MIHLQKYLFASENVFDLDIFHKISYQINGKNKKTKKQFGWVIVTWGIPQKFNPLNECKY